MLSVRGRVKINPLADPPHARTDPQTAISVSVMVAPLALVLWRCVDHTKAATSLLGRRAQCDAGKTPLVSCVVSTYEGGADACTEGSHASSLRNIAAPEKFEVKRHEPRATTMTTCLFPHAVILPPTSRELLYG